MAAPAKAGRMRPGLKRAKHRGAKATAPRRPMERKPQLRIREPSLPMLNRAAASSRARMMPLETRSWVLSEALGWIKGL